MNILQKFPHTEKNLAVVDTENSSFGKSDDFNVKVRFLSHEATKQRPYNRWVLQGGGPAPYNRYNYRSASSHTLGVLEGIPKKHTYEKKTVHLRRVWLED